MNPDAATVAVDPGAERRPRSDRVLHGTDARVDSSSDKITCLYNACIIRRLASQLVILGAASIFGHCHILSPDQLIVFAFSSTYSLLILIMFPVLAQYDLLFFFYALAVRLLGFATARTPRRGPHARGTLGGRAGWFPSALQPSNLNLREGLLVLHTQGADLRCVAGNPVQEGIPFVASQELFCACTASCARLLRTLTSLSVIPRFKVCKVWLYFELPRVKG
jgi:hypothetical protein